jgi:small subunit ribosomal protein S5
MHRSGRRYKISALVIVGNEDGYVGVGKATGTTHQIAIEKATQKAKLNIISVKRGCGSWKCKCKELHSITRKTAGKEGSTKVILIPAPRGIGLICSDELKKLFRLAGINDIWTQSFGKTKARMNHVLAAFNALKNLNLSK